MNTLNVIPAETTGLHVVAPGRTLHWPADVRLFPKPASFGPNDRGYADWLRRHPEVRERGGEGYVVDLSDPREHELCAGQWRRLTPVAELPARKRPKKASDRELPTMGAWLETRDREDAQAAIDAGEAPGSAQDAADGSGDPDAGSGGGTQEGANQGAPVAPDVDGKMFRPYPAPVSDRWAGVYLDPATEEASHLLPAGDAAEPVAVGDVAELDRPHPLVPSAS